MTEILKQKVWQASAVSQLEERFGKLPEGDPVAFSFWIASLLPLPTKSKNELLECTTCYDRLKMEHNFLVGSKACSVQ